MTRNWSIWPRALIAFALLMTGLGLSSLSASADNPVVPGKMLYVRDGDVWVWENGQVSRLIADGNASGPVWSPDGTQVLYVRSGNSYSDLEIYNTATGTTTPLTFNRPDYEEGTPEYAEASAWATDPDWSSSGLIGYITDGNSEDGTTFELWLFDDISAGAYRAPSNDSEDNIEGLSLSPGGQLAAYSVQQRQDDGTSVNRTIVRDLTDGTTFPIAESKNAIDPSISPDASYIAISIRDKSNMSDVFLVNRETGKTTRVTKNAQATNPSWSPDGTWLAFIQMVDYQFEVWAAPVVNGNPGTPIKIFRSADLDALSGVSWTYATGKQPTP